MTGTAIAAGICGRCGAPLVPDDRFCESCGFPVRQRRAGTAAARGAFDGAAVPCVECGSLGVEAETADGSAAGTGSDTGPDNPGSADASGTQPAAVEPGIDTAGFCAHCGTRRPDGTDHFEADLGVAVLVSDVGKVHSRNEDGVAAGLPPGTGPAGGVAAVVCDGISSVSRPEEASLAASETALDTLLQGLLQGVPGKQNLTAAAAAAAQAVAALDTRREKDPPACTFVAAVVHDRRAPLTEGSGEPEAAAEGDPGHGDSVTYRIHPAAAGENPTLPEAGGIEVSVGWIGDSRAYWLTRDPAGSMLLTSDDSWAGEVVRAGLMAADEAMRMPQAHAITRWIGSDTAADPELVRPHVDTFSPAGDGVLLLCSDGLWNFRPEAADLARAVFDAADLMTAARELNQFALDSGGDDNITIVLVDVAAGPRADPAPTATTTAATTTAAAAEGSPS